jgi:hypothetical protein
VGDSVRGDDLSLFRRDLHQAMLDQRGIQQIEVADELGVTKQAVNLYLRDGGSEDLAGRVDDAITRISDRRGLCPRLDIPTILYRHELFLRDLMKAPGCSL